jgi:hypothetical protein
MAHDRRLNIENNPVIMIEQILIRDNRLPYRIVIRIDPLFLPGLMHAAGSH